MLRACNRVLGPGGRIGFHTIHPAERLSDAKRRRVGRVGPPAVSTRGRSNRELLERAGFAEVQQVDLTEEYRVTLQQKRDVEDQFADELQVLYGPEEYDGRVGNRRAALEAIDDGILKRSLLLAHVL